jgi:ATP:corrinoid adenosyltransferase
VSDLDITISRGDLVRSESGSIRSAVGSAAPQCGKLNQCGKIGPPKGWYSRGYLPHFDSPQVIQHITYHLAKVWQREYWDRYIRDERHFAAVRDYIAANPVTAGLASKPEDWPWSSAKKRLKDNGG